MTAQEIADGIQNGRFKFPFGFDDTYTKIVDAKGTTMAEGPQPDLLKLIQDTYAEMRRRTHLGDRGWGKRK